MLGVKMEGNLKKKLQIFISSTYTDLIEERQAAVSAILKAGHIPAGMELFTSGDESQMDTIKRWIDDSDIYMLILGGRYGSVEKTTSLSYTELEYDYAVENEIPYFAVVINEDSLEKKVKIIGSDVLEKEHPQELKLFREKVLSKISSFFDDPKDIKLSVHETISDFEARYDLKGWVHGNEIQSTTPLLEEISSLRKEKLELKTKIEELEKLSQQSKNNSTSEEELNELIKLLTVIEIETNVVKDGEKKIKKSPLINFFITCKDSLVVGVTNQRNSSEMSRLLYFNVCPKLQIHGLALNEKVAGVQYRRFSLTTKGQKLLAYIDRKGLGV